MDRVTSLEVFSRVASLGSLSAAARALGMSQTMATKHMAALEDRLGTKLLNRTTRQMALTEAGRLYLDQVEPILEALTDADAAASMAQREVKGMLRLSVPVSFGQREIGPLLPEFCRAHPHLTIDLGLNDRMVELVEEGWDLSIRIGDLVSSSIVARRLAACRLSVCAAPSYLEAHGTPIRVADLARHNCLGYTLSRTAGANRWDFAGGMSVPVAGSLRANNGDILMTAALGGEGIIYQPNFLVAQEIAKGTLVALSLDAEPLELAGVYAVYPANRRPAAKVRAFIDFLAARFAPVPPWERLATNRRAGA